MPGRKRGLAADALGLIIAAVVMAASVTDNVIGVSLWDKVAEHTPTVSKAWWTPGQLDVVRRAKELAREQLRRKG